MKKVALEDLFVGSIRVHVKGSEIDVTQDQIDAYGWDYQLSNPSTKAASQAQAAPPSKDNPVTPKYDKTLASDTHGR